MSLHQNINGYIKEIQTLHQNVGGVVKEIQTLYQNVDGATKIIFTGKAPSGTLEYNIDNGLDYNVIESTTDAYSQTSSANNSHTEHNTYKCYRALTLTGTLYVKCSNEYGHKYAAKLSYGLNEYTTTEVIKDTGTISVGSEGEYEKEYSLTFNLPAGTSVMHLYIEVWSVAGSPNYGTARFTPTSYSYS